MVASQPIHCLNRHFASMWLRSFILDYVDGVWVKSLIRRCYQERTNDVRYAVITVLYFSLALPFLNFCHFPDWCEPLAVDPQPFQCRVLAISLQREKLAKKLGVWETAKSPPCRPLGSLPTEEIINGSFWKSLLKNWIERCSRRLHNVLSRRTSL